MFQLINRKTQSFGGIAFGALGFLFLLGMHYMQPHPPGTGLQLSFNAFSWIPLSIVLGAGLLEIAKTARIVFSPLTVSLLLASSMLLVPLLFPASTSIIDLGRFYAIGAGLLLFVTLQQLRLDERSLFLLLFWILLAAWIESFLGWAQFLATEPRVFFGSIVLGERPFGVFRQPNVMASFLATGLVLSVYLLARARLLDGGRMVPQIICLLTPLVVLPLLVVLNSRAGWLGALFGSMMVLPYLHAQLGRRIALAWVAMFLLGFMLGLLLLESSDGWSSAVNKIQLDAARSSIYPQVLRMLMENPLLGVGYGNFEASYNQFAAELYANGITENAGWRNLHHPHNELLFWGAEGGVIALAGLLAAAWFVFKSILSAPAGHRLVLVGLLFPIVLHTQTEYPFYHSAIHWAIFVILIFLVDRLGNEQKEVELKSTLLFGAAGTVIPLVTSIFMITTLHAGAVLSKYENVAGTQVDTLVKIVNPMIWQERIRWELGSALMYAGLLEGDNRAAIAFIEMLKEGLEEKPRRRVYQDLILAYEFIDDTASADAVMREAQFRHPTQEFFRIGEGERIILQYDDRQEF